MDTARISKIGLVWVTIVWSGCYLAFGLIPGLASTILPYLLHLDVGGVENVFTIGNFAVGLVIWNLIVLVGILLAGALSNLIE